MGSLMNLRKHVTDVFTKDFHTSLADDTQIVTYNVTDLSPYTTYKATVQAVNKKVGLSLPSDEMEFQTAEIRKLQRLNYFRSINTPVFI